MSKLLLALAIICIKTIEINSGRILAIFPTPSLSHQIAFQPVIKELVRRGHEVVVVTTDPQYSKIESPKNLTEIDLHDISYKVWKQMLLADIMGVEEEIIYQMLKVYKGIVKVFDEQLQTNQVKEIILKRRGEFDLLLTEGVVRPALAFSHIYKVPLIQMNSLGAVTFNDLYIGALTHPLLFPYPWHKKMYDLTVWDKIKNLYHHYTFKYHFDKYVAEYEDEVLRKHFGPDIPSVLQLVNNIQMVILNVHPLWIDNQPVPPNVIYMNGIHMKQKRELPKDLKTYLDSSENGTIYMSFGSNVIPSALKADKMNILLNTLSQLPYDILLKWDAEKLPIQANNFKVSKWLPQADLLRHPKIKLFITQGGLQSLDEAMTAGVPLIAIPLFTDQWYNVEKISRHKIGIGLDMEDLTEQSLRGAINTVITDNSYRENIVRLHALMHDQPQPPLERVVWWIEHVLRHGTANHLKAPTAGLSMAQFIELDLIFIAFVVICATLLIIVYALYSMYNLTRYTTKVKKS